MFSNYDVFVLIVILMSATLATYRGLVREFFSFISWVGAAVLTFIFYPIAGDLLKDSLRSSVVVSMVAVTVTYFAIFFLLSGLSALVLDFSRDVRGGPLDRSAGLLFGVFRGLFIVSLLHYCVVQVQGGPPPWLEKSEFFKLSEGGSRLVASAIDEYVEASGERFGIKNHTPEDVSKQTLDHLDEAGRKLSPEEDPDSIDQRIKNTLDQKFSPEE